MSFNFDFNNLFRGNNNNPNNSNNNNRQGGYSWPNQGQGNNYNNPNNNKEPNQGQRRTVVEEFQVGAQNAANTVQELLHESNVRRIRIKRQGRVILDIPVVAAVVGGVLAPSLAALGAIAAVATNCTIEVTRDETMPTPTTRSNPTNNNSNRTSQSDYDDASFR